MLGAQSMKTLEAQLSKELTLDTPIGDIGPHLAVTHATPTTVTFHVDA